MRSEEARGALGNQVAAVWASLPVGETDPVERLALVRGEMEGLKESHQAVGARLLTELTGFAPPTVMAQAARLQARQRYFNLVVTNVPGPAVPALRARAPHARDLPDGAARAEPRARDRDHELRRAARFGLNADFDALPDLELLAAQLAEALDELAVAAGLPPRRGGAAAAARRATSRNGRAAAQAGTRDLTLRRPAWHRPRRIMESATPAPGPSHRRLRRIGVALLTPLVAIGGFVLRAAVLRGARHLAGAARPRRRATPVSRPTSAARSARAASSATARAERRTSCCTRSSSATSCCCTGRRRRRRRCARCSSRSAAPFDPVLAAAGAAVILACRPRHDGVDGARLARDAARAERRRTRRCAQFADYWLGRCGG